MNLTVFDGGIAKNTVVAGYRNTFLIVESGGTATDTTSKTNDGGMIVRGVAAAVSAVAVSAEVNVESGGILSSANVTSSASVTVSEGGVAYNTVVNYHGLMTVLAGGMAVVLNVNSGSMSAMGEVHDATIVGGSMLLTGPDALAAYTVVGSRGTMYVVSGALASATTVETDGHAILTDPEITDVVLLTPHAIHAAQTITALENGKEIEVYPPVLDPAKVYGKK